MENKKIKKDKKITLYDILMMCGLDEIIDVVYNGVVVIKAKEAKAVVDLLDVLEDKLLNALAYKLVDNFGKIKIYTTDAEEEKENKMDNTYNKTSGDIIAVLSLSMYQQMLRNKSVEELRYIARHAFNIDNAVGMTKEELIDEITKVSARMLKERLEEKPLKERLEELAEKG